MNPDPEARLDEADAKATEWQRQIDEWKYRREIVLRIVIHANPDDNPEYVMLNAEKLADEYIKKYPCRWPGPKEGS